MKSFKIGLSGKKGAGKDTVADMLQKIIKEDSGLEFQRTSFAAELYRFLEDVLETPAKDLLKHKDNRFMVVGLRNCNALKGHVESCLEDLLKKYPETFQKEVVEVVCNDISQDLIERLISHVHIDSGGIKPLLFRFREFIQKVGTDILKNKLAQDFWIELSGVNDQSLQIFSDVRFDDEAVPFVENGFLIHVNAYEGDAKPDCSTKTEQHISEQFDGEEVADVVLHNLKDHMTLQDLEKEVRSIYTTRIRPILLSKGFYNP